ncbi:MAG: DUF427 domain-containing protein [Rhodospirillaceae bacterium]|nr:DUF427 domain-containing protein [Rhodospirillaceae bacterium]
MARAIWNNTVIAESNAFHVVDGYVYFPLENVKSEFLKPNSHTSVCFWKGTAEYFDVVVNGRAEVEAAWTYANPARAAIRIKGHIAFWRGIKVER